MNVRRGRLVDHDAIKSFATDTFAWGDYVADVYPGWLAEPEGDVLVAVDNDDRPVAVVRVRLVSPQEGWISGARVAPDHRRRGVGSLLNNSAVDWLTDRGALVARLAIEDENAAARAQVEKLGYRPVARFIHGQRAFPHLGPNLESAANGGRRLPAAERFDLAPSAEAEPAYVVFSSGDLARAGHGLFAPQGWDFRRLYHSDLQSAARRRQFWTSPSGWAITDLAERELWVGLLVTTAEDAAAAVRALIDLGEEQQVESLELLVPRLGWLEEALAAEHVDLGHSNLIYERPLR